MEKKVKVVNFDLIPLKYVTTIKLKCHSKLSRTEKKLLLSHVSWGNKNLWELYSEHA